MIPTTYAARSSFIIYDVDNASFIVKYDLEQRTGLLFTRASIAKVSVDIDTEPAANCSYYIPANNEVGQEIFGIEQTLYGLIDLSVRSFAQKRILAATAECVGSMEEEFRFTDAKEVRKYLQDKEKDSDLHLEYRVLDEAVNKTLIAIRHVTQVTTLSRKGLEKYRNGNADIVTASEAFPAVASSSNILEIVADYLDHEIMNKKHQNVSDDELDDDHDEFDDGNDCDSEYDESHDANICQINISVNTGLTSRPATKDELIDSIKMSTAQYLNSVTDIDSQHKAIICNSFVPAYVSAKIDESTLPDSIVDHTFSSIYKGAGAGFMVIDILAQSVLSSIFGIDVDLPGIHIGVAAYFSWPYLKYCYNSCKGLIGLPTNRENIIQHFSKQISAAQPKFIT